MPTEDVVTSVSSEDVATAKYDISLSLLDSSKSQSAGAPSPDLRSIDPHLLLPPPLNWDVHSRRKSLFWNIAFIVIFNFVVPTAVYYGLRYGQPDMDPSTLYGIVTAVLGTFELPFFPLRVKAIMKNGGERSALPDNPDQLPPHRTASEKLKLMYLRYDVFQWQFLLGIFVVALCLTLASSLRGALGVFWLLALTPQILLLEIAIQCFLSVVFYRLGVCTPVRLSSQAAGSRILPLLYYPIEDLTAVDGAGTVAYRLAISRRVRLSVPLRQAIEHLTIACGVAFVLIFGASCAIVFSIDDDRIVYGTVVGLTVLLVSLTIYYSLRYLKLTLRAERMWWAAGHGAQAYQAELLHEQRHGYTPDYSVSARIGYR